MAPKVSVIVPVYNVEKYVEQCVRSLMVQTLHDIEIVCVDDGSTDSSPAILAALAAEDPRIRVIRQENAGYGVAVNRGFDEAKGEYLGILESDDFCDEETFELLYNAAKKADADIAKAPFFLYWTRPERQEEFPFFREEDLDHVLAPLDCEYVFNLKASIWSGIYRASFIRENIIRLHESPGASYQDAGFNFQVLSLAKRAIFIGEHLVFYRQDNEASSVNSRDKAFVLFDEYAFIERFLEEHASHPDIERLWELLALMRHDAYMWNYDRVDPKYHVELAKRMRDDLRRDHQAGRHARDLLDSHKWYNIARICVNPYAFVREYDEHKRSTGYKLLEKAAHASHIVGSEGLKSYLGRALDKYVLCRKDAR